MKVFIFVDDERKDMYIQKASNLRKKEPWITSWAKSYTEAVNLLELARQSKSEIYLALDHDLGEEKTGYDVAKYIVENQIPVERVTVHSYNPVGRKNIFDLLTHYGYKCYMQLI